MASNNSCNYRPTQYFLQAGDTNGGIQNLASLGNSGQVLSSNGAGALPTWINSSAAGGITLLNTQTASSSASLAFTSTYITNSYTAYLVVLNRIVAGTTSQNFLMTVSINNGSTYVNTGYFSGIQVWAYDGTSSANGNSSTAFLVATSESTSGGISGFFYLLIPSSTANISGTMTSFNAVIAKFQLNLLGGAVAAGGTVNNISFAFASGNIASGSISIYGVNQ